METNQPFVIRLASNETLHREIERCQTVNYVPPSWVELIRAEIVRRNALCAAA